MIVADWYGKAEMKAYRYCMIIADWYGKAESIQVLHDNSRLVRKGSKHKGAA